MISKIDSEHKEYLLSIAYNMTGDMDKAHDLVQESMIKLLKASDTISYPKSYLRRIVINLTLDYLKELKKNPHSYIGPELPTPVEDSFWEHDVDVERNIDVAVSLLFKKLTPYERTILVLKEIYHVNYNEISELINEKEAYTRKIYSRLKKQINNIQSKKDVHPGPRSELIKKFTTSLQANDIDSLKSLFKEDIQYYVDSGGKVKGASTRVLKGKENVAVFLLSRFLEFRPKETESSIKSVNGKPSLINTCNNTVQLVARFDISDNLINGIYITANPDKLKYISI
jgi:RNA polymerase sigma-70 factor (ECF subfamily)